ncbi:hypothetical protein GOP47_0011475 [Adiantum capillus-veneris]|uniref:Uncharacterized protein n=1 Tax=Adiantum capillus-veneris TaxID=13818 RepID=A0A9D4ZGS9_ADICA|nr:hypothetical protein GOP47_0011475 [Adiantum capillus-veneris]
MNGALSTLGFVADLVFLFPVGVQSHTLPSLAYQIPLLVLPFCSCGVTSLEEVMFIANFCCLIQLSHSQAHVKCSSIYGKSSPLCYMPTQALELQVYQGQVYIIMLNSIKRKMGVIR